MWYNLWDATYALPSSSWCYHKCVTLDCTKMASHSNSIFQFCYTQWLWPAHNIVIRDGLAPVMHQVISWGDAEQVHGPPTRYVKMRVAHEPEMPGTFSLPPRVSDPDMHHGTCVTHVPWCIPGSLTNGLLWSRCRGKRSRHSRHAQATILRIWWEAHWCNARCVSQVNRICTNSWISFDII